MLTFTTTLKERAPVSKQDYYHQRIPTEKIRFIAIKLCKPTERYNVTILYEEVVIQSDQLEQCLDTSILG